MPLVIFSRARLGLNPSVNAVAHHHRAGGLGGRGAGEPRHRPAPSDAAARNSPPPRGGMTRPNAGTERPTQRLTKRGEPEMKLWQPPSSPRPPCSRSAPASRKRRRGAVERRPVRQSRSLKEACGRARRQAEAGGRRQARGRPVGHDARAGLPSSTASREDRGDGGRSRRHGLKNLKISGYMDLTFIYNKKQDTRRLPVPQPRRVRRLQPQRQLLLRRRGARLHQRPTPARAGA